MKIFTALFILCFFSACKYIDPFYESAPDLSEAALKECLQENPNATKEQCNFKSCMSNKITLMGMDQVLRDVDEVLKELKVRYWVEMATVYGARRFNAFLPWDDDVDINVLDDDFSVHENEFRRRIMQKGYRMLEWGGPYTSKTPQFWQIIFSESKFREHILKNNPTISLDDLELLLLKYRLHDNLPHLDIYPFDFIGPNKLQYRSITMQKVAPAGFDYSLLLAEKGKAQPTMKILDHSYPVPNKLEDYLQIFIASKDASDVVLESPHSGACAGSLRFRNIKKNKEILKYLKDYLRHVFGDRVQKFSEDYEP